MIAFIIFALLAICCPQVNAQQSRVVSTQSFSSSSVSSSSQVSASGTTAAELQAQLQSAAETALSTLSSNPNADLNTVIQQLAQVVLSEIAQLFVTLFQQGAASIDASAVAQEISSAVGGAISVAASAASSSSFADIDIDTLQSTIQSSVKGSLSGVGANADISTVTMQVAQGVLNAIGDALAEVTGQSFSFELSVEASEGGAAVTSGTVSTQSLFQASFSSQAQKALATLEANPNDLSNVMSQIATLIITSIQKLLMNMSSGSEIKAGEFSIAISLSIKELLTSLASASGSTYSDIDVDGITSTIESTLKTIFTQSSSRSTINVETIANQVANAVVTNVGPALAEASGATFSFSINLDGTSAESSPVASTSTTIQGISKFETDFQAALETAFAQLADDGSDKPSVLTTLSDKFLTLLFKIVTTITNAADTDVSQISTTIINAIRKALSASASSSTQFGKLDISQITSSVKSSLDKILGNDQNADASTLTGDITTAVLTPLTSSLSSITGVNNWSFQINTDTTPPSISGITATGAGKEVTPAPATSADTSSRSVQLQVSSEILSSLKNTGATIKLIQEAADKQQTIAVSAAFLQAIEEGSDADLSKVLTLFFTDGKITSSTMSLILTLTISGGNQKALNLLTKTIKETSDLTKLSAVFKFAFTTKDSDVTDAFSTLVSNSVKNNKCDLSKVIEAALKSATPEEIKQISAALEKADAKVCIPKEYSSTTTTASTNSPTKPTPASTTTTTTTTATTNSPTKPTPASTTTDKSPVAINAVEEAAPITPTPTPKPSTSGDCVDVTPPGGYTCEQQKKFGKCSQAWLKDGGFCAKTCGTCPKQEACTDISPDKRYSCADQKKFGKCAAAWMATGGYCAATCGRCGKAAPEATPTATPAPKSPVPSLVPSAAKGDKCECNCESSEKKISSMVKDIVLQVLAEIQA